MKTEYKLAAALKQLMAEMPLDSISVTTLTKKCHINRQTFYYHFHDIYDLLTLVFLNEEIKNINLTKTPTELIEYIFGYYQKNAEFINATLNSAGKDLFQEFVNNICYQSFLRFVNNIEDVKKLHVNDRKAISRFYAQAYSNAVTYYLSAYKTKTLAGLLQCFSFLNPDFLQIAVKNLLMKRGKNA